MRLHPSIKVLVSEIDEFRERNGLSATAFGKQALNDEKLVHDLNKGRLPSLVTIDRIRSFMRCREGAGA